jgi:hypothetical protein
MCGAARIGEDPHLVQTKCPLQFTQIPCVPERLGGGHVLTRGFCCGGGFCGGAVHGFCCDRPPSSLASSGPLVPVEAPTLSESPPPPESPVVVLGSMRPPQDATMAITAKYGFIGHPSRRLAAVWGARSASVVGGYRPRCRRGESTSRGRSTPRCCRLRRAWGPHRCLRTESFSLPTQAPVRPHLRLWWSTSPRQSCWSRCSAADNREPGR